MSSAPSLPDRPRRRRTGPLVAVAVLVVAAVVAVVVVTTRGGSDDAPAASSSASGTPKTVSIGVSDKALPYWDVYTKLAASRLGVDVKLVNFSDYSLPNPALSQGQVDINQFQHVQYLANYNVTSGDDLQPIGATAVYPLPLYSTSAKKPTDLPAGAKVAVPNDAVNESRALLTLQAAGLLTLRDGGDAYSTPADVETSKVEVVPVDASQTANALQSGSAAAAVVNNNFATAAKLPVSDVLFEADPASDAAKPYVNLFAVRKADVGNKTYQALADLARDPAVREAFAKDYPQAVVRDTSGAELRDELVAVEEAAKTSAKP